MLIVLFLGFSSGLPLALSGTTLLVWMRESGVDLGTIGLFALVGTPYTVKFLWAPLIDALDVPLLVALARPPPRLAGVHANPADGGDRVSRLLRSGDARRRSSRFGALLVATTSATQDIVVDAFRVESLPENEQAAGMASYVAAYRVGMLVSTAGALFLVSATAGIWRSQAVGMDRGYLAMAALVADRHGRRRSRRPSRSARAHVEAEHASRARENPLRRASPKPWSAPSSISSATRWRS